MEGDCSDLLTERAAQAEFSRPEGRAQASFGIADLEDDKVLGREHVVEIVRVDPEQVRGHSSC